MLKHNNLQKRQLIGRGRRFFWAYGSKAIRFHYGSLEASAGIKAKSKLRVHIFKCKKKRREIKLETGWGYRLSDPTPNEIFSPSRPHLLSLRRPCHQLRTRCSNTRLYRRHLSFKPSHTDTICSPLNLIIIIIIKVPKPT